MTNIPSQSNPASSVPEANRFSLAEMFAHPGPLGRWDISGRRKCVAVVGGGIAGLVAAFELQQLGHQVTLFEGSPRLGGRIHTHRFADGNQAEFGATRIAAHHGCVMHYIERFGIATRPFIADNPAGLYHIGGIRCRMADPTPLWQGKAPAAQTDPDTLYGAIVAEVLTKLSAAELRALFTADDLPARLAALDRQPFTSLFARRLDAQALRIVGHATGMLHYNRVSALGGLIDHLNWGQGPFLSCVKGMDALVSALAKRISGPIRCSTKVIGLRAEDRGIVLVPDNNGKEPKQQLAFDQAIVALPATSVRRLNFDPPLPAPQADALNRLTYSPAARTLALARRRRWELDDGIFCGASRTDLSIQQCWYPGDNARRLDGSGGYRWTASDRARSEAPAAFVAGYRWEAVARRFARLSAERRDASVLADLDRLHPGLAGDVDDLAHVLWDEAVAPGSGAYAFFRPGQRDVIQRHLGRPWPAEGPRLFFAGEHLAIAHASIQGAIQTALRAVVDVAGAPAPQHVQQTTSFPLQGANCEPIN